MYHKKGDMIKDHIPLVIKKDEAATYSSACGSTIGAGELNGRVRNGNGWVLPAMATSSRWYLYGNGEVSVAEQAMGSRWERFCESGGLPCRP